MDQRISKISSKVFRLKLCPKLLFNQSYRSCWIWSRKKKWNCSAWAWELFRKSNVWRNIQVQGWLSGRHSWSLSGFGRMEIQYLAAYQICRTSVLIPREIIKSRLELILTPNHGKSKKINIWKVCGRNSFRRSSQARMFEFWKAA